MNRVTNTVCALAIMLSSISGFAKTTITASAEVKLAYGNVTTEAINQVKLSALVQAMKNCNSEVVRRLSPWATASSQRQVEECVQTQREGPVECSQVKVTYLSAQSTFECLTGPVPDFN